MEVKVGQVWKNKSGAIITIIGLDNRSAALKMASGEIGCHPISFVEWQIQRMELELASDQKLSDLEIVQKALDKTRMDMCCKGGKFYLYNDVGEPASHMFDSAESLLTWAKQTIGMRKK